MRKQKAYLGQRRIKHKLGRNRTNQWVIPTVLRNWFQCRQSCAMAQHQLKVMNNSSWGKTSSNLLPGYYADAVAQRRVFKEGELGRLSCAQMDAALNGFNNEKA